MPAEDHWSADRYAQTARFVTDLGGPVVALLEPRAGERILDLGCGDGPIARGLMDIGCDVVGVDASEDMVASARALGVDARIGDGERLDFDGEFDAVFSNAALHWMTDAEAVIAGAFRALKPGGRFVAEQGGHGNVAAIRVALMAALAEAGVETDLTEIWSFPSAEVQEERLKAAGFLVETCTLHPRPTPVAAGLEAWFNAVAGPAVALAPADKQAEVRARAAKLAAPALRDEKKRWVADYVRLRFRAVRP